MKINHTLRISIPKVHVDLVRITRLGILGCSNTLASKPAASGLSIQVNGAGAGAGARGITSDPAVTAGSVVVMAYDSITSAYLGTTGKMVKGADFYTGNLVPSANGTLWFRAFVKDSTGNFLYYGEGSQIVTDATASISITIIVETTNTKTNRAAIDLDHAVSQGAGGSAGNYVILSKAGITNVPGSAITGNIAVSPILSASMTGFPFTTSGSGSAFSTTPEVTGKVYASDYANPTPAWLTEAVSNMETAYTATAGVVLPPPYATELGAGDISGMTLIPGLYKWGTGVQINSDITLNGGPNDVWIFQISQDLTIASGKKSSSQVELCQRTSFGRLLVVLHFNRLRTWKALCFPKPPSL